MSYSDATPDSPVPNPPFLQLLGANIAAVAALLAPYFDPLGAGAAAEAYADTTSRINFHCPARWHNSANYRPAAAGVTQVPMDVIDDDPTGKLANLGAGLEYGIADTGRYLCVVHLLVNNGTTSPATIASILATNGTSLTEDVAISPASGGFTSVTVTDLRPFAAGQILQPFFSCSPVVPVVVGGAGADSWMFVARVS